jgi:hypothetical protein
VAKPEEYGYISRPGMPFHGDDPDPAFIENRYGGGKEDEEQRDGSQIDDDRDTEDHVTRDCRKHNATSYAILRMD